MQVVADPLNRALSEAGSAAIFTPCLCVSLFLSLQAHWPFPREKITQVHHPKNSAKTLHQSFIPLRLFQNEALRLLSMLLPPGNAQRR